MMPPWWLMDRHAQQEVLLDRDVQQGCHVRQEVLDRHVRQEVLDRHLQQGVATSERTAVIAARGNRKQAQLASAITVTANIN